MWRGAAARLKPGLTAPGKSSHCSSKQNSSRAAAETHNRVSCKHHGCLMNSGSALRIEVAVGFCYVLGGMERRKRRSGPSFVWDTTWKSAPVTTTEPGPPSCSGPGLGAWCVPKLNNCLMWTSWTLRCQNVSADFGMKPKKTLSPTLPIMHRHRIFFTIWSEWGPTQPLINKLTTDGKSGSDSRIMDQSHVLNPPCCADLSDLHPH